MKIAGRHILVVGVTGGIGSGKSEVCAIFERLGVPVLRADDISKSLSVTNAAIRKSITKLLGPESYQHENTLNRSYVANRIFSDSVLKKKLESILHPAVEKELKKRIRDLSSQGKTLTVVEAALIFEAGSNKWMDAVVVVDADESVRVQRVQRRDHADIQSIKARIAGQMTTGDKVKKADYVLHNDGSLAELETKVNLLYSVFTHIATGAL